MLRAGLRVHEVAELRLRDFSSGHRGNKVQVNSSRPTAQRTVPLDVSAARAVLDYIGVRPTIPHVEHLFVSQRGQPLSMRSIQRIVDTYAHAAGLKHVCAQSLRHTCAKIMLESTRDAALVARWLGHTNTRILGKYQ
jgi:site-specific recombinase XerD